MGLERTMLVTHNVPVLRPELCYSLDVCILPKFLGGSPHPHHDGIWRRGSGEVIVVRLDHGVGTPTTELGPSERDEETREISLHHI